MTMATSKVLCTALWGYVALVFHADLARFVDHVINGAACQDSEQMVRPMPMAAHH